MGITLVARQGVLVRKVREQPGMEVWMVAVDDQEAQAVVYLALVGAGQPGDQVLLNTTAVELELGTGGQHFVIARQGEGEPAPEHVSREDGHIMKLRYTPLQCRVCAAEEEASPYHDALRATTELPGTPVVCLGLHSQLAPAVGGIKAVNPALRVAYVMTDSAALPLAYSRLVAELTARGLLDLTVTVGQAFGGTLEAVNIYSGLVTAVVAGGADIIIAGQGPGNAGTGTPLGFGGIEQAVLLNAAGALAGRAIAVPRISFADPRPRHAGISHHTQTVLGRLTLAEVLLPVPVLAPEQAAVLAPQLAPLSRHRRITTDGTPGIALCRAQGITLRSMGRSYEEDAAFFLAAAAAGRLAAELTAG